MLPPYLLGSSVDQLVALDPFFGVELDYRPHEHPFLISAARVDGQRLADLDRAFALVDVTVQGEKGLVPLDRGAHRRGSDGAKRPPAVEEPQVGVDRGRFVESRL